MTISAEERERRRLTLGGSDMAALLGYTYPYATAADVILEKLYPTEALAETDAMEEGNFWERPLVEYAAKARGLEPVIYSPPPVIHEVLPFHANLDGLVPGKATIEAKFTGRVEDWGEKGTDDVPPAVIVQATWGMFLAKVDICYVPAALVKGFRRDRGIWEVRLDDELARNLAQVGEEMWVRHVVERRPVEPHPPTLDTLKRIQRVPNKAVPFPVDKVGLIFDYNSAHVRAREADQDKQLAKAKMLLLLGDGDAAVDENGETVFTYFRKKGRSHTCTECGHVDRGPDSPTFLMKKGAE